MNKVILMGHLGNDPEIHNTQQGNMIVNFSIATDESYKDKNTGHIIPKTEWHRVVIFNRLAEVAQKYLHKGSRIYIEGRLQTKKWQGQDGQDRYTTEIVAIEMEMLDSKNSGSESPIKAGPDKKPRSDFYTETPSAHPSDFDDIPF